MKNKILLWIISATALFGLVDAGYLTYTRFAGIVPPCSVSFLSGCATVAKSSYSVFWGIPLSLIGMVFYVFALVVTLSLVYKKYRQGANLLLATTVIGALFSAYFVYLQAFVIKAFCIYCVASALASFIMVTLSVLYKNKEEK